MKKLKSTLLAACFLAATGLAFTPQMSNAQGAPPPDGKSWVCCQSLSDGCTTMGGLYFEHDYKYYGETCP